MSMQPAGPRQPMPAAQGRDPQGVKFEQEGKQEDNSFDSEDQELLFSQAENTPLNKMIDQAQRGTTVESGPAPLRVLRLLPFMKQLAEDPESSPAQRAFYAATVRAMEQRMKNGR